jgi:hypothetical protein
MEALEPLVGGGIVALNAGDYSPDPDANPRVFPFSSIFISNPKSALIGLRNIKILFQNPYLLDH